MTIRVTDTERGIIRALAADQVPGTWIAETVNRSTKLIYKLAPLGREATLEWRRVWTDIRRTPALLELHREFAPGAKR